MALLNQQLSHRAYVRFPFSSSTHGSAVFYFRACSLARNQIYEHSRGNAKTDRSGQSVLSGSRTRFPEKFKYSFHAGCQRLAPLPKRMAPSGHGQPSQDNQKCPG